MDLENFNKLTNEFRNDPNIAKETLSFQFDRLKLSKRGDILNDPNINILDVGSWEGARVKVLRDMDFNNAIGVELNKDRVAMNPELIKEAPAHQLPFGDETIDLILVNEVFSDPICPKSDGYRNKVLNEFARVLKKGGVASIAESDIMTGEVIFSLNKAEQKFKILENDQNLGSLILERLK